MIYGYTRVSTQEQTEGQSLSDQARKIKGVALMMGTEEPQIFSDAGVSGTIALMNRPEGKRLIESLAPGDTIVVAKLDRMFRNAVDALSVAEQLAAQGVHLVLADISHEPVTHNGTGKLFFGILAQIADFERERIAERLQDGREAKKKTKGYIGGRRPFGYLIVGRGKEARLRKLRSEQVAIERMKKLREDGWSLRQISAEIWEKDQFKLNAMSVKRILDRDGSHTTMGVHCHRSRNG